MTDTMTVSRTTDEKHAPRHKRWLRRLTRVGHREQRNLLLLLGVALAIWALAELTDEVLGGDTHAFDAAVIMSLRVEGDTDDPIGPDWLEEMARDATALGGTLIACLATIGGACYLWIRGRWSQGLFLLISVGSGLGISTFFKMWVDRPRPELVPHGSIVYTASFPSGHSMMSAAVYLTIAALLMRAESRGSVKLFLLLMAAGICLIVGLSRVYLGVHWPTDVLAGWTAGAAWAIICYLVGSWIGIFTKAEPVTSDLPPE